VLFTTLTKELLERNNVTLHQEREIAQAIEASELTAVSMEQQEHHNKVSPRKFDRQSNKFQKHETGRQLRCYACGREGHIRTDAKCPAKGKKCRKCKKEGHFEVCCETDTKKSRSWRRPATVRSVESDSNHGNGNDDVYVFTVINGLGNSDFIIEVGGVKIPVIVDSGASVNVIDRCMWEWLKGRTVKCVSRLSDKQIYGCGNDKPLNVAGCFNANVSVNHKCVHADFFVVEEKGQALLRPYTPYVLSYTTNHIRFL
jgi:hypothetical protein